MKRTPNKEKIEIKPVAFKCDKSLGKDIPFPLPATNAVYLLVGQAGSGKTTLLTNLIKDIYKKKFNRIWIFAPRASLLSLGETHIFNKYIEDTQHIKHSDITGYVFNEISPELLNICKEEAKQDKEKGWNTLVILDDQMAHLRSNVACEKQLIDICANHRHYSMSLMILSQLYLGGIPKRIRLQACAIFLWRPVKKEIEEIGEELFSNFDKKEVEICMKELYQEPHDFIYITQNKLGWAVYDKDFAKITF